jgi:S-adenosylhomocysteine hydrolase
MQPCTIGYYLIKLLPYNKNKRGNMITIRIFDTFTNDVDTFTTKKIDSAASFTEMFCDAMGNSKFETKRTIDDISDNEVRTIVRQIGDFEVTIEKGEIIE